MNRFGGLGNGGEVSFAPQRTEDVPGVRLQPKICEICGKGFFRRGAETECRPCAERLNAPKERFPSAQEESDWIAGHPRRVGRGQASLH